MRVWYVEYAYPCLSTGSSTDTEGKASKKRGATPSLGRLQVWGHSKCGTISSVCVCVCVWGATSSLHVLYHKDTTLIAVSSQRHKTSCITKTQDLLCHKDTRLVVSRLVVSRLVVSRLVVSRLVVVCCGKFQSAVLCCRVLQSLAKCCRLLQNIAMIQDIHLHTHTPGGDVKTHITMNV